MAHNTLVDLVKCSVTSDGAGALVLGAAVPGFRGADCLVDGAQYGYSIQQGSKFEYGEGVFTQALGTLTRNVLDSSNGGLVIRLDPNAVVSFVVLAKDLTLAAEIVDEIRALTAVAEDAAAAALASQELAAAAAAAAGSAGAGSEADAATATEQANLARASAEATELIGDQVSATAAFMAQVLTSMGRYYASRATAVAALAVGDLFTSNEGGPLAVYQRTGTAPFYVLVSVVGYAGAVTGSQLTQATDRMLGRTTGGTGAIEELTVDGLAVLGGGKLTGRAASHGLFGKQAAGEYISPLVNATATTTVLFGTGFAHMLPLRPMRNVAIDRLEIEVTGALAGGSCHLAVYPDINGRPDTSTVLARTATPLDCASTGIKNTGTEIALTLERGQTYWIAIISSGNITFRAAAPGSLAPLGSSAASLSPFSTVAFAQSYAVLPTTCPATSGGITTTAVPLIRARTA